MLIRRKQSGFTILELLVVVVIIGILLTVVFSTYAGIHRNQNNQERQRDIQDVYQQLEAYYVENSQYPTLADMNSTAWVTTNMKTLNRASLQDPNSKSFLLTAAPMKDAYAYEVTATDGSICNDKTVVCAHYTLIATLQGGSQKTYVKSSLN
jgi:prepilin-type N-terminal cleavage/methylation domain-containing protein